MIPTQPRPPMTPSGSPSTQHPPTLSARRHFVDWSDPALPGAARILLERGADGEKTGEGRADRQVGGGGDGPTAGAGDRERVGGAHGPTAATTTGVLDLSELLVILPGGRAGRRLLELLLDGAEARGRALRPPRIATLGALPEILFPPVRPEPGPLVERRVWAEALRDLPPQGLELLLSRPPARGALSRWMGLGRLVRDLQRTVGAEGHTFADVARACQEGLLFNDEERWALLARAQRQVRAVWRREGVEDTETRRERILAGEEEAAGAGGFSGELWLVGVAEMSGLVRRVLSRAVGEGRVKLHAIVHAPATLAPHFDPLGCVDSAHWRPESARIPEAAIRVVEGPREQAAEVVRALRDGLPSDGGALAPEEVTLGALDPEVIPFLTDRLTREGAATRIAEGIPLERTLPALLLQAVAEFLDEGAWEGLAALVRHPDLPLRATAGGRSRGLVELADRYHSAHLPARVVRSGGGDGDRGWLPSWGGDREGAAELSRALDHLLDGVLGELAGEARPLSRWGGPLAELVLALYGADSELDPHHPRDREVVAVSRALAGSLQELDRLPEGLDDPVSGSTALRIVLDLLRGQNLPPAADDEAVELLGWLELHLDDARHMVISGVNEPFLPEAVTGDPFLPHELRRRLGLMDNERRWARDLYQLTAILHSRPGTRIVAGRRTLAGDPLRPSRLLLTGEGEELARRLLRFLGGEAGEEGEAGEVGEAEEAARPEGEPSEGALPVPGGDGGAPFQGPAMAGGGAVDQEGRDPFALPPEPVIRLPAPPRRLAVTAFRSLLADPYRFALERLLRLEPMDDAAREMDPMVFGVVTHAVLEALGRASLEEEGGRLPGDEAELRRRLDHLLDREFGGRFGRHPHPAVRLQKEQIRGRLHAFARWQAGWSRKGWVVAQVEAEPPLLPEPEQRHPRERGHPFPVDGDTFYLRGRIDRVDHHPETGEWLLLDYKTSKKARMPDEVHRKREGRGANAPRRWVDLQLPLYRHLVRGIPDDVGDRVQMGYINLPADGGETGEAIAPWDRGELEEADEVAREAIRFLLRGEFEWTGERSGFRRDDPLARLLGVGVLEELSDDEEGGEDEDG